MSDFDTLDLDVFLSDFALTVNASTWGKTVEAIFDEDYVEFASLSDSQPSLILRTSDLPASTAPGDLFTFTHPTRAEEVTYKLVDGGHAEPGLTRLIVAAT